DLLVRSQTLYPTELRARIGERRKTILYRVQRRFASCRARFRNLLFAGTALGRGIVGFSAMTERLYYTDSYLREFSARVVERSGDLLYLDRTAFYPTSGGQPFDTGAIAGVSVVDVFEDGERIAHRTAAPIDGEEVACAIAWDRRFDHMQQHTGQHLLSAVFAELHRASTLSFHLGEESSTIDIDRPSLDARAMRAAEERANAAVVENRPVMVSFEDAAAAPGLRKPSGREGTLRIVGIEGLDRSACGGTHVRATGEIGPILIRKLERVRDALRVEFLCGFRAVRRARADFDSLTKVAQMFSSSLDEAPGMVAAHMEASRAAEKQVRRLAGEVARYRGHELYDAAQPGPDGLRRYTERAAAGGLEELRAVAQSFTARPKAVYVGVLQNPPSVLLAVSADAGIDAGKLVKEAVSTVGGRGGGTARMAQGSVPDPAALGGVVRTLEC
ncbi:MAG TPA: DHHA1 domain-containing protein, partial [Bryobacteraceae bacterium]|nr:DHHA1 domain-containing protein [Bryobacteraceae bacterium]